MNYYKFPNELKVAVDSNCPSANSLDEEWQQFRCHEFSRWELYIGSAKTDEDVELAKGDDACRYNEVSAWLHDLGISVEFASPSTISIYSDRDVHVALDPFLDYLFVGSGSALVHSASLVGKHGAVLLAGWGGTGKTSAVCSLTRDHGMSFVSDDLSIISESGLVYGYRRPMCIYPYHRRLFPEAFAASRKPTVPSSLSNYVASARQLLRPMFRGHATIERLAKRWTPEYLRLEPAQAMPWAKIVDGETVTTVVILDRWTTDRPRVLEKSLQWATNRLTGNYLVEMRQTGRDVVALLSSTGLFQVTQWIVARERILNMALKDAKIINIQLPLKIPPDEIGPALSAIFIEEEII